VSTITFQPAISWRLDYISRNRFHQEEAGQGDQGPTPPPLDRLKCGDFYVTRHSNLSDVHVVFHMITDESVLQGRQSYGFVFDRESTRPYYSS
jgi:hypothetical protein